MQNLEWYLADLKSTGKNTIETVEKSLTDMFIRLARIYPCLRQPSAALPQFMYSHLHSSTVCRAFVSRPHHSLHKMAPHGLTTPNASPIEIHVKCLNSTGRFYFFLPSPLSSAAYHNEALTVHFQKQLR